MKILQVLRSMNVGGAEMHAWLLADALQERGISIRVATPAGSWLDESCKASGIETYTLPMRGTCDLVSACRLARYAKNWGADLIHGHLVRGAHYAWLSARLAGMPCVATAHATNSHKRFHRADAVIAVSEATKRHLVAHKVPKSLITRIYPGVSPVSLERDERDLVRREIGLRNSDVAVITVARFIYDKGQDVILAAWQKAKLNNVKLVFVGDHGTAWGRLVRKAVKNDGLEEKVLFLGERRDVLRLLPAMDIFALPSRREALGLACLEAMSAGLPVLASHVGGIPEVVSSMKDGILVPTEDVESTAQALSWLVWDVKLRRRLGENALNTFSQRFSIKNMADRTVALYGRMLWELRRNGKEAFYLDVPSNRRI